MFSTQKQKEHVFLDQIMIFITSFSGCFLNKGLILMNLFHFALQNKEIMELLQLRP